MPDDSKGLAQVTRQGNNWKSLHFYQKTDTLYRMAAAIAPLAPPPSPSSVLSPSRLSSIRS